MLFLCGIKLVFHHGILLFEFGDGFPGVFGICLGNSFEIQFRILCHLVKSVDD